MYVCLPFVSAEQQRCQWCQGGAQFRLVGKWATINRSRCNKATAELLHSKSEVSHGEVSSELMKGNGCVVFLNPPCAHAAGVASWIFLFLSVCVDGLRPRPLHLCFTIFLRQCVRQVEVMWISGNGQRWGITPTPVCRWRSLPKRDRIPGEITSSKLPHSAGWAVCVV